MYLYQKQGYHFYRYIHIAAGEWHALFQVDVLIQAKLKLAMNNLGFLLLCCLAWPVLSIHGSHYTEEELRQENAKLLLENKRMASFLTVAETISSQYIRSSKGFEIAPLCNSQGMCESKENPELRVKCEDTEFMRFCLETCRDSYVRCAKVGQVATAHSRTARYGMRIAENPGKLTSCEIAANAGLPLPKDCPQDRSIYTSKQNKPQIARKIVKTPKKRAPLMKRAPLKKTKKQITLLPAKVVKSKPQIRKKIHKQTAKKKIQLQVVAENAQDQQDAGPEEDVVDSPDQEAQNAVKAKPKADSGIDVVKAESDRNSNIKEQGQRLESEQTVDGKSVESPGSRPI